ncbi:MAG: CYTH domain-containing protein [Intestinibacillus sp.]
MERELKWKADTALHRAVAEWAIARGAAETRYEMDARYYDTASGLLASQKAGLRLRLENGHGVCCLKCGGGVSGAAHLREEYECPADSIEAGVAALLDVGAPRALCQALLAEGVEETCRVRFIRRALTLRDAEMTAELALDCGTLSRQGRTAPLCEIELELKHGDEKTFFALGNALSSEFSLIPEPQTKLARASAL